MTTINRYPFATRDGKSIPTDIIKITSSILKAFTAASTIAEALPTGTEVVKLRATQNCWIKFANSVTVAPVSATPSVGQVDTLYLLANEWTIVAIPAEYYSVIRDTVDGTLIIMPLTKWAILGLEAQIGHI